MIPTAGLVVAAVLSMTFLAAVRTLAGYGRVNAGARQRMREDFRNRAAGSCYRERSLPYGGWRR